MLLAHQGKDRESFLKPNHNCWVVCKANRLSVLIDAADYYKAFIAAVGNAKKSVIILAWDIDTRVNLMPNEPLGQWTLEHVLRRALDRNPTLHVHILCWNFAMIYALERQVLPSFQRIFHHPRVHFFLDGHHPLGASQHQKIITIDDHLAFVGGLDICAHRWDTSDHHAVNPNRRDHKGKQYDPFHDMQVMVDGEAAQHFTKLAKERWRAATSVAPADCYVDCETWPKHFEPELRDVYVGVARSQWSSDSRPAIQEIEHLYLDSIRFAKRHVYIENQYFTSDRIADAICDRLSDPHSPEFVLLMPRYNAGFVEQLTVGVLRLRVLERIRKADIYGKFRVYFPVALSMNKEVPIYMHSKVMIVDDQIFHAGSSNLSNRSMGLDTEADIVVSAEGNEKIAVFIAEKRNRLIAEHLDVKIESVEQIFGKTNSLFAVIDQLGGQSESSQQLKPFAVRLHPLVDLLTPNASLLDPVIPLEDDPLFADYIPYNQRRFEKKAYQDLLLKLSVSFVLASVIARRKTVQDRYQKLRNEKQIPEAHLFATSLFLFFAGAGLRLSPDSIYFFTALLLRPRRPLPMLLTNMTLAASAFYALGALTSEERHIEVEKGIGGTVILRSDRGKSMWPHLLVNVNPSLLVPFHKAGINAGRKRASFPKFLIGTTLGQVFRIGAAYSYGVAIRRIFQTRGEWGSILSALTVGLALSSVSRWKNKRFLPIYKDRNSAFEDFKFDPESGFIKAS